MANVVLGRKILSALVDSHRGSDCDRDRAAAQWLHSAFETHKIKASKISVTSLAHFEVQISLEHSQELGDRFRSLYREYKTRSDLIQIDWPIASRLGRILRSCQSGELRLAIEQVNTLDLIDLAVASELGAVFIAPSKASDGKELPIAKIAQLKDGAKIVDPWFDPILVVGAETLQATY